ncbi:tRNA-histidine guanylyltransferase 1-like [Coelomomyces lativittatus]|nr:tRNA-histidine guanylyltransferase 1-like [Coelomomyces lativittatus]
MACSKFEYVKEFESDPPLLKSTWIVVRIDGKGFHKFSKLYHFNKPNDPSALHLMNEAATHVMDGIHDLSLAYGQSDEYSFLFKKSTNYYNRRPYKLASTLASLFTAHYILAWHKYFPNTPLHHPPSFDARAITYPSKDIVRDYFAWRQADCHINNLHNTAYWALVLKKKLSEKEATQFLERTSSASKNELLFSEFGINYNNIDEMYKKGTVLFKEKLPIEKETSIPLAHQDPRFPILRVEGDQVIQLVTRHRTQVQALHADIIGDSFWAAHPNAIEH